MVSSAQLQPSHAIEAAMQRLALPLGHISVDKRRALISRIEERRALWMEEAQECKYWVSYHDEKMPRSVLCCPDHCLFILLNRSKQGGDRKLMASRAVKRAVNYDTGEVVMMKAVRHSASQEISYLKRLQGNPLFAQLLFSTAHCKRRSGLMTYAFMPRYKVDMVDYINAVKIIPWELKKQWMEMLVRAVHFLHSSGIVHRDIKVDNLLINHDLSLCLADFGHAEESEEVTRAYPRMIHSTAKSGEKFIDAEERMRVIVAGNTSLLDSCREIDLDEKAFFITWGTSSYFSPQVAMKFFPFVAKQAKDPWYDGGDKEEDIWALGVTLSVIFQGKSPSWSTYAPLERLQTIARLTPDWRGEEPPLADTHQHLIWEMNHPDLLRRPTIEHIVRELNKLPQAAKLASQGDG